VSPTVSSVRRRVLALLQLSVFAFSLSTSLLPCENVDVLGHVAHHEVPATASMAVSEAIPATTSHDHAHTPTSDGAVSAHALGHASSGPSHDAQQRATPGSSHQDSHESLCPLVVGCVGMVQGSLDASWRSGEAAVGVETPRGVTLGRAYADRSVDSPPPRV